MNKNQSGMRAINNVWNSLLLLGLIAAVGNSSAFGEEAEAQLSSGMSTESSLTLRGFGTLGIARSSSDQAEFVRDLSQPRGITNRWSSRIDSILGAQANWQATSELELVGQVVSRYRYDGKRIPEIMWAFAKWEPDSRISLRAGRIGADFMMLADSRLVGYSYLTVRPPSDFFGPLFFSHFDGADVNVTLPVGEGLVRGKVFAGATHEKTSGTPGIWDTSGSPVRGFVIDFQSGAWLFRANAAEIRFSSDINFAPLPAALQAAGTALGVSDAQVAANALTTKGTTTRFFSIGVVYDQGPMQVQAMLNTIHHESGVFQNSRAGYVLAGYRVDALTPYAGVSWWHSHPRPYQAGLPNVAPFDALNTAFASIMAASTSDQTTYTLGTRWDVRHNAALKAQWDAVRGSAASRFPVQQAKAGWDGKTDVLSLTFDFIF